MKHLGLVLLALCTACGAPSRGNGGGPDASGGHDGAVDSTGGSGTDGVISGNSLVYAHSATILYKIDTATYAQTEVGAFSGISGSVTDIAVDKNGAMVAITNSALYTVDVATAAGTQLNTLGSGVTSLTGLGYVPDPTNDANDLLVTADANGDVYSINPQSGAGTKVGNYGKLNGKQIASSGDIFGVRGFGIYASVKVAGSTNDFLAKIDPSTWTATVLGGVAGTGFKHIFGIGFWAGTIYGFDDAGDVLKIDATTGVATAMATDATVWWGAGVTTNAPIIQ